MNELPVIVNRHRLKSILILMRRGSCLTELVLLYARAVLDYKTGAPLEVRVPEGVKTDGWS